MAALMFLALSPSDAAANVALYTVWVCSIRFACQGITSADFELSRMHLITEILFTSTRFAFEFCDMGLI
jgi:hypothetical protein